MKTMLNYLSLGLFLISYFSFMYMADHLYRKKIIKHRLFGLRPDIVFVEYYKDTKKETGQVGSWFWITIWGFIGCLITFLVEGFTLLIVK